MILNRWKLSRLFLLGFFLLSIQGFPQSKNQLKQKRSRIQKELRKLNGLLGETRTNKRKSEIQLLILSKKIGAREELISAIGNEVVYINRSIENQEILIDTLKSNLTQLRVQYAKMVQFAYKNRNSTNKLIFIFSSEDFNQAYKRLKYIHEIGEYREYQAEQIALTQLKIEEKILELKDKKARKLNLKENKKDEFQKLQSEQGERNGIYAELKKDEKKLRSNITKKRNESKKLQAQIKKIIEREIAEAKKRAEASNKGHNLTPRAQKLSKDFTNNKGKLPWPVSRGTISGKFGNQKHAFLEHVTTINNGIDILTNKGTKARVVFEGTVVAVIALPGDKKAILVQHGNFYTMYSNLDKVFVKKGDKLETQEDIGTIITDESGKTEVHFELWEGNQKQNPSFWITIK
jgi:septal ring factor EnvC (AmiA/AmiB activator)